MKILIFALLYLASLCYELVTGEEESFESYQDSHEVPHFLNLEDSLESIQSSVESPSKLISLKDFRQGWYFNLQKTNLFEVKVGLRNTTQS